MNSITEARVLDLLRNHYHYDPYECGTIIQCMRNLARAGGNALDERFQYSGLGSGPEARVAAGIVDRALMGGGSETSDYEVRQEISHWLRTNRRTTAI